MFSLVRASEVVFKSQTYGDAVVVVAGAVEVVSLLEVVWAADATAISNTAVAVEPSILTGSRQRWTGLWGPVTPKVAHWKCPSLCEGCDDACLSPACGDDDCTLCPSRCL